MASEPPEEGLEMEHLVELTRSVIYPGTMKWQSPRFFGYYTNSINVTNVFADMFAVISQTPAFSYTTAPAWTELENIVMDWSAKALGLPDHFLLSNSGGGIINNSATESIFNSVHIAKFAKRKELGI
jgi:aromatic-L-amino-acid/L-tryptophan decarboxylase